MGANPQKMARKIKSFMHVDICAIEILRYKWILHLDSMCNAHSKIILENGNRNVQKYLDTHKR